MKAYIADIIPKIKRYSKRLDELTLLTNLNNKNEKIKITTISNLYAFTFLF